MKLRALSVVLLAIFVEGSLCCGGIFKQDNGILRSPARGTKIGQRTRCDYVLQVPYGQRIKVVFIDLVLRTACCSCKHDYVELRDGPWSNSTLIGRYCAQNLPKTIYSTGNELWIRFESNFRTHLENRFRLTFNAICGRHFTSLTGSFWSPGFPQPYEPDTECIYTISVPRGRIKVQFESFDLELEGHTSSCDFDYLEVKDIRSVEFKSPNSRPSLNRRYCGTQIPPIIYSTKGSFIWFRFKTDSSGQKSGFSAKYRTVSVGEGSCNRKLFSSQGLVYSQNYPFPYPRNKECYWEIEVEKQKHVHLYFDTFNFSRIAQHCMYGHVRVYDSLGYTAQIGQYCGTNLPRKIVSSSNKLTLRSVSSDIETTGWFSVRYVSSSQGPCGPKKFTCKSRQCIEDNLQCDGRKNCNDGSDEVECPPNKDALSWYSFWPVTVVVVMLFMGIWLWRTWRKFISPHSEVEMNYCASPCHHHSNAGISEILEPPSYNEAISQQTQPPPSYEEAVATQAASVVGTSDLDINEDGHTSSNNLGTSSRGGRKIDSHSVTIECDSGNQVVGYHRRSIDSLGQPYTSHRSQDSDNAPRTTDIL